MSIMKYFFSKKYREETKRNFSNEIIHRINDSERELEMIYKNIFNNTQADVA